MTLSLNDFIIYQFTKRKKRKKIKRTLNFCFPTLSHMSKNCMQGLIQDLGSYMNVSSLWSVPNFKKYCRQSRQICFALKDEFYFQVQRSLSTDFGIRIMPFLIKNSFSTVFDNTNNKKKSNFGAKLFAPKSDNRCHFCAILGHRRKDKNFDLMSSGEKQIRFCFKISVTDGQSVTDGEFIKTPFSKYKKGYMTIILTIIIASSIYYQDIVLAMETAPPVKSYFFKISC